MAFRQIFVVSCLVYLALGMPQRLDGELTDEEKAKLELERAKNAKYSFSSSVEDGISDLTHSRDEVRDGLSVRGSYVYSDGYYKRRVTYEADQNGYRVVSDVMEPLPDGPQVNPTGIASVKTNVGGSGVQYTIQGVPVEATEEEEQQPPTAF